MNLRSIFIILFSLCEQVISLNILCILLHNGRSHHIFYSKLIKELSNKHHITVINYNTLKRHPNIRQISLKEDGDTEDSVEIDSFYNSVPVPLKDFVIPLKVMPAFEEISLMNCKKLIYNEQVMNLVKNAIKFDVILSEQFISDCGFAIINKLNAPAIGISAHVLMPWSYERLGLLNHPAFTPNHFMGTGFSPNFLDKIKSFIMNQLFTWHHSQIQKKEQLIVSSVYPEIPPLEKLVANLSMMFVNQYFPLTGNRIQGVGVVEIGGIHIEEVSDLDTSLKGYINSAKHGLVYISFGTVARSFPKVFLEEILKFIRASKEKFIWKLNDTSSGDVWRDFPDNVIIRPWIPQIGVLCNPNTMAFVTHSGMLSSAEAMHCGVPVISIPLFGDQFANAASAREVGLGVTVDFHNVTAESLAEALMTVSTERFQQNAKKLSALWKDRQTTPLHTAIYWIEYIAKHRRVTQLNSPLVNVNWYEFLMLDIIAAIFCFVIALFSLIKIMFSKLVFIFRSFKKNTKVKKS